MNTIMKIIALTVAMSLGALAAPASAAEKMLLKTPVAFGTHLPGLGTPIVRVAK